MEMKMNQKDYYQVLGVDPQATPQEVKEAYRREAFQYHPDRNRGNPSALEKMKEINEAYAVLSHPQKRRDYDNLRERYGPSGYDWFKQRYSEQDIFRGSDINQIFEEMARTFGFRSFDEVFKESYGQGYRTFEFNRPGFFGKGFIFFGSAYLRDHPRKGEAFPKIPIGSMGKFTQFLLKKFMGIKEVQRGKDLQDLVTLDPQQAQEGGKIKYTHWKRSKELAVTIPPGIREGQKIRLRGMGEEGKDGGDPGDLYLIVRTRKPFLKRMRDFFNRNLPPISHRP
jgi:DnaJ-class molecular chaperone